jgi:hypothetical protein
MSLYKTNKQWGKARKRAAKRYYANRTSARLGLATPEQRARWQNERGKEIYNP